ncbi:hypothetical protein RQP46_003761 [Phenoliferia psychrophenolica]
MNQATAPRIAAVTAGVAALGVVSYALYFDYRRRHDPVFRKNLNKQKKHIEKVASQQQQAGRTHVLAALRRALAIINSEPGPTDVAEKEVYFMEQVGMGEQLAARSPEHYVSSAISFYRALKVYPAPHELIMIYQKTQPPLVFDLVMEMITLDVPPTSRDPRDSTSEALLTEIEPEAASSPPAAPASENGSLPSTTTEGSFVHVDDDDEDATVLGVGSSASEPVAEVVAEVASEDPPEPAL